MFGSLPAAAGRRQGRTAELDLKDPVPLDQVLGLLGLPPDKVQMAMVNHRAAPKDHQIRPGDRVALFPKEAAIFPDWKDFRF